MTNTPAHRVLSPVSRLLCVFPTKRFVPVIAALALLLNFISPLPVHAQALKALVLGGAASPNGADAALTNRLASLGFQVTYMDDNVATVEDAEGMDLLVTLASGASGAYQKFQLTPVPVINAEQAALDGEYLMILAGRGTLNTQTQIDIVNPDHQLAAGLSGKITVYNPAENITWGTPPAGNTAIRVATTDGSASQFCIFGYDTGELLADGATPAPARRLHFMLSDNSFLNLTAEGLRLFDAAVRWAADLSTEDSPPRIINISPADGALFEPVNVTIGFTATTHPANQIPLPGGIQMFLNGVDVTAELTVTGSVSNRVASYTNALAENSLYTVQVVVKDDSDRESFRIWNIGTLSEATTRAVEAENFNFDGGTFINNPVVSYDPFAANSYYLKGYPGFYPPGLGIQGVDYNELNGETRPFPSFGEWRGFDGPIPQTDDNRSGVTREAWQNAGAPEYDLANIVAGEWVNFTRDFNTNNYKIYLNVLASADQTVELRRVANATAADQTTLLLGRFEVTDFGGYRFVQLTDPSGGEAIVHLGSVQTLRLQALTANNDLNINYFLLAPTTDAATILGPYVHDVSPAKDSTMAGRDGVSATITDRETAVNVNTVQLLLNGTPVTAGLTVTPTATGADVNYVASPPFAPATKYSVQVRYNDTVGSMFSNAWSFSTSPDALPNFTAARIENEELKLLVAFAEPVDALTAGEVTNYTSDQGVTFSSVALLTDTAVELTGTAVADGQAYQLTIQNIEDTLGNLVPGTTLGYNISPFLQDGDGLVVFESESYHTNTPGTDVFAAQTWVFSTAWPGYSGGGSMLNPGGGNVATTNVEFATRMDYRVRFVQPGIYKIWIRATELSNADAIFYGVDGTLIAQVTGIAVGAFNWNDDPEDEPNTGTNSFTIAAAGDHTINVWVAEDGLQLDKLVIVRESEVFNPATMNGGLGPDQSRRVGDPVQVEQPVLQFSMPSPTELRFDWTEPGFHLEQAGDAGNPDWTNVPNGGTPPVTVPVTGDPMFFRLSND